MELLKRPHKTGKQPTNWQQQETQAPISRIEGQRISLVFMRLRVQGNLAEVRTKASLPERGEQWKKHSWSEDTTQGTREILGFSLLPV